MPDFKVRPTVNGGSITQGDIDASAEQTVLEDTNAIGLTDTGVLKWVSWATIKAAIATYLQTLAVWLTGDQTVAGIKTFTNGVKIETITAIDSDGISLKTDDNITRQSISDDGTSTFFGSIYQTPPIGTGDFRQDTIQLASSVASQTITIDITNTVAARPFITNFAIAAAHSSTVAATVMASGFVQWVSNTTGILYSYDISFGGGTFSSGSITAITNGIRITFVKNSQSGTLNRHVATFTHVGADDINSIAYSVTVT